MVFGTDLMPGSDGYQGVAEVSHTVKEKDVLGRRSGESQVTK